MTELATESTALVARTSIVKVEAALAEFDAIEAGLTELREKYTGVVFDVKSGAGMKEATAARAEVREPRYKTEHARKAGKAPVLALGRNIEDRATYITEELLKIETPIDDQIKAEEARKEAEREAKQKAEQERILKIQSFINEVKQFAVDAAGKASSDIEALMDQLEQYAIDERFGEFRDAGEQTKVATMNRLNEMHTQAADREAAAKAEAERLAAEQLRIRLESEELARRQAEQDKAEKKARKEAAERERQQKAEMDAAIARRMAEDQAARDKLQAEEAASKARIEAQEREAREARAKADAAAMALRIAEEQRLRAAHEAEDKKRRAEILRLEKEREAKERRDREAREKIEAKARAKAEKEEAARLEAERKKRELLETDEMIQVLRGRITGFPQYARIASAIDDYLENIKVPA